METKRNTKNPLEWTVFGLSCILVTGVVLHLLAEAVSYEGKPAELHAEIGGSMRGKDTTTVEVKVTNSGSHAAEGVRIRIDAVFPDGEEEGEITIDYIPREGSRESFVVFDSVETPLEIKAGVTGFSER